MVSDKLFINIIYIEIEVLQNWNLAVNYRGKLRGRNIFIWTLSAPMNAVLKYMYGKKYNICSNLRK